MLKLFDNFSIDNFASQPPSGGCVLKPRCIRPQRCETIQPPSGGCVLKQGVRPLSFSASIMLNTQPPSGGCVLKQGVRQGVQQPNQPAAFRRLCVETFCLRTSFLTGIPAAFRRLCVETFWRLSASSPRVSSRLQAAVC